MKEIAKIAISAQIAMNEKQQRNQEFSRRFPLIFADKSNRRLLFLWFLRGGWLGIGWLLVCSGGFFYCAYEWFACLGCGNCAGQDSLEGHQPAIKLAGSVFILRDGGAVHGDAGE